MARSRLTSSVWPRVINCFVNDHIATSFLLFSQPIELSVVRTGSGSRLLYTTFLDSPEAVTLTVGYKSLALGKIGAAQEF